MDIRGPRLRKPSDEALAFTSSTALDGRIARRVIAVNTAHMVALVRAGEVDRSTGAQCLRFLLGASPDAVRAGFEDFHQQLEQDAVDSLGVEAAGYLNYGKSRNDQVATAIRMELRLRVLELFDSVSSLQEASLAVVRRDGRGIIPGYTHLQRAQPVTLAHHFFAHFDSLQRDAERLLQLYARANLSPMGAAAMAGTSVKVDRRQVASALGFSGIIRNAMDAVSSRDMAVEALACATMTMLDAGRMAEELILWSSAEFGFVELDDRYSASSSIMPQKKNAVVAETVRAKAGSVLGGLVAVCAILKALPYSYNLDLQEATPHLWRAFDDSTQSLHALAGALSTASFKPAALREPQGDNSTAVALANYFVKQYGISFREAHSAVGELVTASISKGIPLYRAASLSPPKTRSGKRLAVDEATARKVLDPKNFLAEISTEGGSNPKFIAADLALREKEHSVTKSVASGLGSSIKAAETKLHATASGLAREVKARS